MEHRACPAEMRSAQIEVGRNAARVRIPRMEVETDYFLMEEVLLSEVCRRTATNWIIDLSDHQDGVTLVLAGVLSGICEEARRRGHTVRCAGIQKPCAPCHASPGALQVPAVRTVKESWIGLAE